MPVTSLLRSITLALGACLLASACGPALPTAPSGPTADPLTYLAPTTTFTPPPPTASPSPPPASQPSVTPSPLPEDFWKSLPVIPEVLSDRMRATYRLGQQVGNQARVFSRIGDCASAAPAFLIGFDGEYNLGEFTWLQPAVDYFQGSFSRPSLAAKAGLNTSGLLTTLWTDAQCRPNESLLACQYRLDQPAFAIISLGTNEAYYVHRDPGSFERNLRIILEETLRLGIVPILATKADNVEGDHAINATIARLALEYELPLWNFWRAVQPLPGNGLVDPDHLTTISQVHFTDFSLPDSLEYGMQVRNLTALQVLNFLMEQLGTP